MAPSLTYAMGDIHGRFDLLQAALTRIAAHARGRERRIVTLGDMIDRGPNSCGVVEQLMRLDQAGQGVCLMGNHEAMLRDALDDPFALALWLQNGGEATLESYGADHPRDLPADHLAWLTGRPMTFSDPHRTYVHAGLRPGVVLEAQDEEALLWIRERFLRAPADRFSTHVVHGHTPQWAGKPDPARPEQLAHRTNLDSGAYMTGVLTVGVFLTDQPGGPVDLLYVQG